MHLGVEPELFADDDGRLIQFSSLEVRQSHLRQPHEYKTTRGTQWHSEALALSGTQWHSVALSGTQRYASEWGRASGPSWQHPRYSGVIRGHQSHSWGIQRQLYLSQPVALRVRSMEHLEPSAPKLLMAQSHEHRLRELARLLPCTRRAAQ